MNPQPSPLRILIIANNTGWDYSSKIKEISDFYSPVLNLSFDIRQSHLYPVPFEAVDTLDGINNAHVQAYSVDSAWFEENVTPSAYGYDIVAFHLSGTDLGGQSRLPAGITCPSSDGIQRVCMFVTDPNENCYMTIGGQFTAIGNAFAYVLKHEISHCVYADLGIQDNTHLYFYGARPEKVLADFAGVTGGIRANDLRKQILTLTQKVAAIYRLLTGSK